MVNLKIFLIVTRPTHITSYQVWRVLKTNFLRNPLNNQAAIKLMSNTQHYFNAFIFILSDVFSPRKTNSSSSSVSDIPKRVTFVALV